MKLNINDQVTTHKLATQSMTKTKDNPNSTTSNHIQPDTKVFPNNLYQKHEELDKYAKQNFTPSEQLWQKGTICVLFQPKYTSPNPLKHFKSWFN